MITSQQMLKLGAYANFGIAVLHIILGFAGEQVNRFFGAPKWVLVMARENRPGLMLLLLGMAGIFSLFAVYGLSGAHLLRRLPLLRTGLIFIGSVYALRGLEVILDVYVILRGSGQYLQFLGFSLVALCVGLLYLGGTIGGWKSLEPLRA